jgi:hypothetical protein
MKFKHDPMAGAVLYKPDTLVTSYAILTRERRTEVRCISTFPKAGQVRLDECYYNDTDIPESTSSFFLQGKRYTGVTRKFNKEGVLEYVLDHDKGTWEVAEAGNYPYHQALAKIKGIADSLLIKVYGQSFFNQSLIWSPLSSVIYDGRYSGAGWCDYEAWKPKRYLLKYAIRVSPDEFYDDQVEVQLDSMGRLHFPFGEYNDIRGFDGDNLGNGFQMNRSSAIEKAKANGMVDDGDKKPFAYLNWRYDDPHHTDMFNGHFSYNVVINTEIITFNTPNKKKKVEYKYDAYVFDPWSGEFRGIEKMKSYGELGTAYGMPKGLLPDTN